MRRVRSTRKGNLFLRGTEKVIVALALQFLSTKFKLLFFFILIRFMVLGPDGSHYMASPEAQVAGSDADDA